MFESFPPETTLFSYDHRLRRVVNYVDQHYAQCIRLNDVAAVAGLESSYFSKYFRRHTGINFKDWLATYRLDMACNSMRERKRSITEVAILCGFGDMRNFERATMKYLGKTPSALRAALRPSTITAASSTTPINAVPFTAQTSTPSELA